jgi:tetratricopeptide (TPR) repeat protein
MTADVMVRFLLPGFLAVAATAAACGPIKPHQESADAARAATVVERGWAAHEVGDWREAERAYLEATQIDPSYVWAYYRLGVLAANNRLHGTAEAYFRKAIAVDPSFMPPHYELGVLQSRAGNVASAAGLFARAVELAPLDPQARLQLGIAYEAIGLRDEAVTHLTAASVLAPEIVEVFIPSQ